MNFIYAKIDLMFLSKMMFLRRWRGSSITNYRVGGRSTEPHIHISINYFFKIFNIIIFIFTTTFFITYIVMPHPYISINYFFSTSLTFIYKFIFNFIIIFYFSFFITYNTNNFNTYIINTYLYYILYRKLTA